MKRQIRRGVFETNSSSTHSLTMMMKSDYDRWQTEQLYLYEGGYGWEFDKPTKNHLYTRDEAVEFVKKNKYYKDEEDIDDGKMRAVNFLRAFIKNLQLHQVKQLLPLANTDTMVN